jgi:hypothetical protein
VATEKTQTPPGDLLSPPRKVTAKHHRRTGAIRQAQPDVNPVQLLMPPLASWRRGYAVDMHVCLLPVQVRDDASRQTGSSAVERSTLNRQVGWFEPIAGLPAWRSNVPERLENGINLYAFRYVGDDRVFVGVDAGEIAADPRFVHAVRVRDGGFLAVDYHQLGLKLANAAAMRSAGERALDRMTTG